MKSAAFASLDMRSGEARCYYRVSGNHAIETGRLAFSNWDASSDVIDWAAVEDHLTGWLAAYVPPEDDGPRPTPPLRTAKEARAA